MDDMCFKVYVHPVPCPAKHDYRHDMLKVEEYIRGITHSGYHKGSLQHLGSAASFHDHLTDLHYGHACAIKKELKRVLDYLYMYAVTGHTIHHFMAEDAFEHVEQLQADTQDPQEKEHVQYFLNAVKEYMGWLKIEKTETGSPREVEKTATRHGGGTVNL